MKIDRITFSKIKSQYELLKMRAAYIMAERYLMDEEAALPEKEIDWNNGSDYTISTSLTPEEFNRLNKPPSQKELIHQQLLVLEAQLKEAEDKEEYESCEAIMEAIKILRRKFTRL